MKGLICIVILFLSIQFPVGALECKLNENFCSKNSVGSIASKIKLVVLDVDGVLTDGTFTYDESGNTQVSFHVHDFVGIMLGMRAGIKFAVITAGESPTTTVLIKKLKIEHYCTKCINKYEALEKILKETGYTLDEVAFIGDDYVDETCMRKVTLPMSVPNAMDEIKAIAKWVSTKGGGKGAVREAIEYILKSQGKLENIYR